MKRTRKQRNVKDDDASYRPRKRASTSKPAASSSRPTATTEVCSNLTLFASYKLTQRIQSTASTAEERTDSRSQEPAEDLDRPTLMNLDGVNIALPYLDVHEYARGLNKSEVRQRRRPDQLVATIMHDWSVRKMFTWAENAERAASEAEETAAVQEIWGIVGSLKWYLFANVRFAWDEIAKLKGQAIACEDMVAMATEKVVETESRRAAEAEEAANKLMAEAKARQRSESNLDAAKSATTMLMAKLEEASAKEADLQRQMILLKEMNASLRSKHAELCTKNAELVTENAKIMRTNAELYRMNQELQLAQISGDVGNAIKVEED